MEFATAAVAYLTCGGLFLLTTWASRDEKEIKLCEKMTREYGSHALFVCLLVASLFWPVHIIQLLIKGFFRLHRRFLIWQVNRLIKRLNRMEAEMAQTQVALDQAKASRGRIAEQQATLQKMLDDLNAA